MATRTPSLRGRWDNGDAALTATNHPGDDWIDRIQSALSELPGPPLRVRFQFWLEDVLAEMRKPRRLW